MGTSLLLVTGIHRSGTSALAELLQGRGAKLAEDLLPDQPAINARGFWEDAEVVAINESLLQLHGIAWHDLSPLEAQSSDSTRELADRALSHLSGTYTVEPLGACKDPRFCRTLPFWLPLFQALDIQPKPILVIRHPAQVAASLNARDGLPAEYGCLLWLTYTRDALHHLSTFETPVIDYADLLSSPIDCIDNIASSHDLTWPRSSDEPVLQPSLQHHHDDVLPLDSTTEPGATIAWVYKALRSHSRIDGATSSDLLERIDWAMEGSQLWCSQLSKMAGTVLTGQAQRQSIGEQHSYALSVIAERDAQLEALARAEAEARATVSTRDSELEELACLWEAAQSTIQEKDRDLSRMARELDHAGTVVKEREASLAELQSLLEGWPGRLNRAWLKWRR